MPAALPGSTDTQNRANPSAGRAVMFSPFSGPKGSPFDAKRADYSNPNSMTRVADTSNISTGGLSTGLGFGLDCRVPGIGAGQITPQFTDDYTPGLTNPDGTTATLAVLTSIGGGKSGNDANGTPAPYVAQPLLGAGNGGSRDAGAGPAYTGFFMKLVTATGAVANGAAIETGFSNRSGVSLATGQSQFGSSTAASPAVT